MGGNTIQRGGSGANSGGQRNSGDGAFRVTKATGVGGVSITKIPVPSKRLSTFFCVLPLEPHFPSALGG